MTFKREVIDYLNKQSRKSASSLCPKYTSLEDPNIQNDYRTSKIALSYVLLEIQAYREVQAMIKCIFQGSS